MCEDKDYANIVNCYHCNHIFRYQPEDTWYDEHGSGYCTKLVKCPECGQIIIIKYLNDKEN